MQNQSGSEKDPQSQENGLPEIVQEVNTPAVPGMKALNIQSIMSQAVRAGNVEMAEKMLNLYDRMKAQWAKEQFDKAMAKFQADCPIIEKTKDVKEKDGRTVRYSYAPLDSIVAQTKQPIANNGLSYTVKVRHDDKMLTVVVTIKHIDGHSEDSEFAVPIGSETFMSEPQKYGARCTFAKRYAFCNAFGILTGDGDTDAVEEKDPQKQPAKPAQRPAPKQEPKQPQASPNLIETPLLNQVRIKLRKLGAKNEDEALQFLKEITGIKWFNMKASEKQAEFALKKMNEAEAKDVEFKKEPKEGDICTTEEGKVGTLVKVDGKLVCLIEDAVEDSFLKEEIKKTEVAAESPKKRYPVPKGKVGVIKGLLESKRGYKTEKEMVQYINTTSKLGGPEFPRRQIGSIEDLDMDEADKIIKILMTMKSDIAK